MPIAAAKSTLDDVARHYFVSFLIIFYLCYCLNLIFLLFLSLLLLLLLLCLHSATYYPVVFCCFLVDVANFLAIT